MVGGPHAHARTDRFLAVTSVAVAALLACLLGWLVGVTDDKQTRYRGRVSTILTLADCTVTGFSAIFEPLILAYGWRGAYRVMACAFFVVLLLPAWLLHNEPGDWEGTSMDGIDIDGTGLRLRHGNGDDNADSTDNAHGGRGADNGDGGDEDQDDDDDDVDGNNDETAPIIVPADDKPNVMVAASTSACDFHEGTARRSLVHSDNDDRSDGGSHPAAATAAVACDADDDADADADDDADTEADDNDDASAAELSLCDVLQLRSFWAVAVTCAVANMFWAGFNYHAVEILQSFAGFEASWRAGASVCHPSVCCASGGRECAVSYTHLTLPTIYSV